ncbi:CRISPR-associated protein Cas4 [[Eubacterium] cellulosolvens]
MDPTRKTKNGVADLNSNLDQPIISASDIERYGYCPLSWWIKYRGVKVTNERLERGTKDHREIISEVSKVEEREKYGKTIEFNIKIFALISIILAINAVAILLPLDLVRNLLIFIAASWIVIAILYFSYSLLYPKFLEKRVNLKNIQSQINPEGQAGPSPSKAGAQKSLLYSTPQSWKRSAIWFLIIAGGLAFNGMAFLQPASSEIMSRIFMISALLWLIGTMVILYLVLRYEEIKKKELEKIQQPIIPKSKWKLGESEKLVIGFAVVATLLAINGLTVQYRERISTLKEEVGLIILALAGLWLGLSFAFLYISFRSRIVSSLIEKDIERARTESKKYKIIVDRIKSFTIPEKALSYNWPMFITGVAVVLGINSILIRYGSEIMSVNSELFSRFLVIISLLWLIGAFIFLFNVHKNTHLAEEIRRLYGIYQGKIEYADKMDRKSKMLFSEKYKIRGKPDYIVKIKGKYVPVEIKTGKVPRGPHFSHIIQIAAYCLLIKENYNTKPPYGIISYGKMDKHKINFDKKLEDLLIQKIGEMRQCIKQKSAHRNHKRPGKCRNCSRRKDCPERLE